MKLLKLNTCKCGQGIKVFKVFSGRAYFAECVKCKLSFTSNTQKEIKRLISSHDITPSSAARELKSQD